MNFKSWKLCGILLLSTVIFSSEKFTSNQVNASTYNTDTIRTRLKDSIEFELEDINQLDKKNNKLNFKPMKRLLDELHSLVKNSGCCLYQNKKDICFDEVIDLMDNLDLKFNKLFNEDFESEFNSLSDNYDKWKYLREKVFKDESDILKDVNNACIECLNAIGSPISRMSKKRVNVLRRLSNACTEVINCNYYRINNFNSQESYNDDFSHVMQIIINEFYGTTV